MAEEKTFLWHINTLPVVFQTVEAAKEYIETVIIDSKKQDNWGLNFENKYNWVDFETQTVLFRKLDTTAICQINQVELLA